MCLTSGGRKLPWNIFGRIKRIFFSFFSSFASLRREKFHSKAADATGARGPGPPTRCFLLLLWVKFSLVSTPIFSSYPTSWALPKGVKPYQSVCFYPWWSHPAQLQSDLYKSICTTWRHQQRAPQMTKAIMGITLCFCPCPLHCLTCYAGHFLFLRD